MLKNTLLAGGLCLTFLIPALPASAQEPATLVMRSGERISGELVDLGGAGFTIRVNGTDRQVDQNQVAVVEFVGANPNLQRARAQAGQPGRPHVVLRNGDVFEGSLYDVGGTRPLRLTVQTPNGQRDYTSNDVAQIYYANAETAVATTGQAAPANVPAGDIRVEANRDWTDTGITVRRGERLTVNPNGNVNVGPGVSAGVNGTQAVSGNNYPVKSASAGALIGRVGNGPAFVIGAQTQVTVPADGRLFLGVNDDNFSDNDGFFSVGIARQSSVIRRR
jgi:hypothetical protein